MCTEVLECAFLWSVWIFSCHLVKLQVERKNWVKVEALNARGKKVKKKYTDWTARIFQVRGGAFMIYQRELYGNIAHFRFFSAIDLGLYCWC